MSDINDSTTDNSNQEQSLQPQESAPENDPTANDNKPAAKDPIQLCHRKIQAIRGQITKAVIGQDNVVDLALVSLLAAGHLLIEGVPGLGKTLLVKSIAKAISGDFSRIQFTPDLMPSDVTGHAFFDQKDSSFKVRKGPAFTNLLLADEINRAPAKTQASLLEVMQEQQITIEGTAHTIDKPFMVLATQNPLEQEGTYALPEAELDRFLLNATIEYPDAASEHAIAKMITEGHVGDSFATEQIEAIATVKDVLTMQKVATTVEVDDSLYAYAVRLVQASRQWPGIRNGAGPRATIALIRCAKALVLLRGGQFVTPDDIKQIATPVLRHRMSLSAELEIEGVKVTSVIQDILEQVEAPRG